MEISMRAETTSVLMRPELKENRPRDKASHFKIAETLSEFDGACRLVHDLYVREGYIDPQPGGMRVTPFSLLSATRTFIGCEKNNIFLTVTLFGDSPQGLPMDSLYRSELDMLRKEGRKIAEVGALAVKSTAKLTFRDKVMMLFRIVLQYAWSDMHCDDIVIVINPKHRGFYEKVLSFKQIGGEEAYEYVKGNPAIALRLDLKWDKRRFFWLERLLGGDEKMAKAI